MSNDNKLTITVVKLKKSWLQFVYDGILTVEEAAQMQTNIGYSPCYGYDFYHYKVRRGKTYWKTLYQ